ncbi:FecR domain-containing protein (plasmid) [Novosphingobium resinovorum]|uniref:FecR family protein n=1 Tax=Novosphingobium TaxID=165696 RepID=UPI001B3C513B|nr:MULTISPECIES: FecR domain-containing protein [Novosphingobium]MBF7015283.1 FecR domain-containing protein [Novosphingobium sp. HR1a]WJM29962.1 FecR domain-containing protein [Novosphingobium resinovorum]
MTQEWDLPADRDEQAALWCLELAEGELSPALREKLDAWLAKPDNHDAFQRAAAVWDMTEAIASMPEVLHMRSGAIDRYREATLRRWKKPPRIRWWVAGILAPLGAAAAGMAFWLAGPESKVFDTGIGETQVAMLDDGSRLSLDGDSSVQATFGDQRRALVLEKGRARFDVAHNPLRPFTVSVGDKLVVATGTSFSVEKLGAQVHVVLYQGRVAILRNVAEGAEGTAKLDLQRSDEEFLSPGQELTMPARGNGAQQISSIETGASWGKGQVSFDDIALPLAVERMNRYSKEPLVIADEAAGTVRVTGVFETSDNRGFLDALRQLNGVRAKWVDGKVQLTKP